MKYIRYAIESEPYLIRTPWSVKPPSTFFLKKDLLCYSGHVLVATLKICKSHINKYGLLKFLSYSCTMPTVLFTVHFQLASIQWWYLLRGELATYVGYQQL